MLTVFTMPKPFRGHIDLIQRNTLGALTRLTPRPQIIIFGDEPGTAEVAREFDLEHVPAVARNEHGTPIISDFFEQARQRARHKLLCYLNADIILLSDFMDAVRRVRRAKRRFLMVGRRWDLDLDEPVEFSAGWETALRERVQAHGQQHNIHGIDYFLFPRRLARGLPPMLVGRGLWDNWFLYHARACGAALVDASTCVLAIHQNHDYSHIPGGQAGAHRGIEAQRNKQLAGGLDHYFTLRDATHELTRNDIRRFIDRWHVRRWFLTVPIVHPFFSLPVRAFRKLITLTTTPRALLGLRLSEHEGDRRS